MAHLDLVHSRVRDAFQDQLGDSVAFVHYAVSAICRIETSNQAVFRSRVMYSSKRA